jgi:apolipoprotein N-acyltransferase
LCGLRPQHRSTFYEIADFFIGSPAVKFEKETVKHYNSVFLVGPDGNLYGKYDKAHLVPFGEYVPFKKWLPFLGKMVESVGDFHSGKKGQTIQWGKHVIGSQICYEIIFPNLARAMTQNKAELLINVTNDAWYGRSSAPYQHFSMAKFRAVENRRSLIRAANTGISGFIDPSDHRGADSWDQNFLYPFRGSVCHGVPGIDASYHGDQNCLSPKNRMKIWSTEVDEVI